MDKKLIGVDLGGTTIKFAITTEDGEIQQRWSIETNILDEGSHIVPDIIESINHHLEMYEMKPEQFIGIGMGTPGTVDLEKGTVVGAYNLNWKTVQNVKEEIEKGTNIKFAVDNDANVAALGERWKGAGENADDVVFITLGTGVGGGIAIDGKLYDGRLMGGSELGHCVIVEDGEPCSCGRKGCLEAYVSATALIRDGKRSMEQEKESVLWEKCKYDCNNLTPEMIFEGEQEGDRISKELLERYRKKLATGIANLVNLFRPQLIVIGGGISIQGENLLAPIREMLETMCFGKAHGELPELKIASLGNDAGMIGASNLIFC